MSDPTQAQPSPSPEAVAAAREIADRYISDDRRRLEADVREIAAVIERCTNVGRLRAVIDRLPKTADGAPITPGMTVCWDSGYGAPEIRLHDMKVLQQFDWDGKTPWIELRTADGRGSGGVPSQIYSTREAAKAALSAPGADATTERTEP